ncbi:MAG: hypothetical protein OEY59_13660 [Deltaproteobacteria bacterium]|nr:hypothetical protein [Deltaproteobacteria bacterium]
MMRKIIYFLSGNFSVISIQLFGLFYIKKNGLIEAEYLKLFPVVLSSIASTLIPLNIAIAGMRKTCCEWSILPTAECWNIKAKININNSMDNNVTVNSITCRNFTSHHSNITAPSGENNVYDILLTPNSINCHDYYIGTPIYKLKINYHTKDIKKNKTKYLPFRNPHYISSTRKNINKRGQSE